MTFDKGEKNKRGLSPQSNPSVSTKKRATDRKENQAWEQKRQEEKIPREGADARSSNLTMPSLSGPLKKEETEAQDEHGRHFPYNAPSPTTEAEFGKQDQSMLDAKQQIEAMVFAMQALANNNAKAKRLVDPWVGKFQQVPEVLNQAKNGHEIQKLLKEKNLSSWLLQQRNRHEKGGPLDPDKESPLITKDIADLQRKLLKAIGSVLRRAQHTSLKAALGNLQSGISQVAALGLQVATRLRVQVQFARNGELDPAFHGMGAQG